MRSKYLLVCTQICQLRIKTSGNILNLSWNLWRYLKMFCEKYLWNAHHSFWVGQDLDYWQQRLWSIVAFRSRLWTEIQGHSRYHHNHCRRHHHHHHQHYKNPLALKSSQPEIQNFNNTLTNGHKWSLESLFMKKVYSVWCNHHLDHNHHNHHNHIHSKSEQIGGVYFSM